MNIKKLLVCLLVLVMVVGTLPLVFADQTSDAGSDPSDIEIGVNDATEDVPEEEPEEEIVYGDADGNGSVTTLDATVILQKIAGWDVTLNEAAADADGSGAVTTLDATAILQKIAGWDVTLGPQQ